VDVFKLHNTDRSEKKEKKGKKEKKDFWNTLSNQYFD